MILFGHGSMESKMISYPNVDFVVISVVLYKIWIKLVVFERANELELKYNERLF